MEPWYLSLLNNRARLADFVEARNKIAAMEFDELLKQKQIEIDSDKTIPTRQVAATKADAQAELVKSTKWFNVTTIGNRLEKIMPVAMRDLKGNPLKSPINGCNFDGIGLISHIMSYGHTMSDNMVKFLAEDLGMPIESMKIIQAYHNKSDVQAVPVSPIDIPPVILKNSTCFNLVMRSSVSKNGEIHIEILNDKRHKTNTGDTLNHLRGVVFKYQLETDQDKWEDDAAILKLDFNNG